MTLAIPANEVEAMRQLLKLDALISDRKKRDRLSMYFPDVDTVDHNGVMFPAREKYPKQLEFFARGKDTFARMFLACVGGGKTEALLYELSCHARGWYPDWWEGVRYNRPLNIWVCGKTIRSVRDILQTKWIGMPNLEAVGGGILPVDWLDLDSISRLSQGSIDSFRIKRADGTATHIGFKAYEQGVGSFYGTDKDIVAYDEPCPVAIYAQGLMRTRNRENARVMYTVAALEGKTETVALFMDEPDRSRVIVTCSWDEIPHLTEEWKRNTLANTPMYLRDSVRTGVPSRSQGAVYPIPESEITVDPFPIPKHWRWMWSMDGGYHNTAAGWYAYDADSDTVYKVSDYKDGGDGTDLGVHAARIKARHKAFGFPNMPGVGDASAISQLDGKKMLTEYQNYDLNLRLAKKSVDTGVAKVLTRLADGRFKIFKTCVKTLDEYRNYSYKVADDGSVGSQIVKIDDHCLHPDTLVITRAGKVAIRDLVGTTGEVLSIDGYMPYRNCRMTAADQEIVEVLFSDGATVKCTPDHRFMTVRGWVEARDLTLKVCPTKGWQAVCLSVTPAGRSDVYCLTVPEAEAFAIENGIIVHNCMDETRYAIMDIEVLAEAPSRNTGSTFKELSFGY